MGIPLGDEEPWWEGDNPTEKHKNMGRGWYGKWDGKGFLPISTVSPETRIRSPLIVGTVQLCQTDAWMQKIK